ncbi:gamma-soluble NSF attachment protein [Lingula anatina]|uniref:Gamma-soluble NSF attachment protein n=1 Tax=Lingula anatina TaxID=7574 RepID=A0A2R2MRZ6_LINAN|nr:gamma-soluble NSF attachment protein [Lingula anatina]|eukprot:XP_023932772.1 gamma-soluble NSF attachment protein [Lingula anatina]
MTPFLPTGSGSVIKVKVRMAHKEKKIAEALDHIKAAEKYLKTSFFKWKPDYDSAANEYLKAGVCYRNAKELEKARDIYVKAAEVQLEMKALFHAAKAYEQAGLISKDMNRLEEAANLMERAGDIFRENGVPDTASLTLEKAAKMIEASKPDRAIMLYMKACDVVENEDRPKQAAEVIKKAAGLLVRCERLVGLLSIDLFEEASKVLQREIDLNSEVENYPTIYKAVLNLVLVHLHKEDYVAADKSYKGAFNYPGFVESEEASAVEQLLDAYDQGDNDTLRAVCNLPLFKYQDNQFAKLARDLAIPGEQRRKPEAVSGADAGSGSSDAPQGVAEEDEDEEDEYAGGLL